MAKGVFDSIVETEGAQYANNVLAYISEAREGAIKDLIRSAYRRHARQQVLEDKVTSPLLKLAVADLGVDAFKSSSKSGRKSQSPMKWITISAKDGIDPKEFMQQMSKCIKKQKLQANRGQYSIEQRSEGAQDAYGWHIHWLVEFTSTTSTAIIAQQVYQCFTRFCAGPNYVDIREVYNEEQWQQKNEYQKGNKKVDKMMKVFKDRSLRLDLDLPEIISY